MIGTQYFNYSQFNTAKSVQSMVFLLGLTVILVAERGCKADQAGHYGDKKICSVAYNLVEHIRSV